jgi:hypothetical protein
MCLALALLCVGSAAQAEGVNGAQKSAASAYFAALATGNAEALAYAIHPDELEKLRMRLLNLLRDEAKRDVSTTRTRLFGQAVRLQDLEKMTTLRFFAQLARRLSFSGREYSDYKWLQAVPDAGGVVHIVARGRQPKEREGPDVVVLASLMPYGKDWKAIIPMELQAQVVDLIAGRGSTVESNAAATGGFMDSSMGGDARRVDAPKELVAVLSAAEHALAEGDCAEYYKEFMSPTFRRTVSKSALDTLIASCERSLGTREILITTLRIVKGLKPRLADEGVRAVYDVSEQGLPFDRFVMEKVSNRWYIAE